MGHDLSLKRLMNRQEKQRLFTVAHRRFVRPLSADRLKLIAEIEQKSKAFAFDTLVNLTSPLVETLETALKSAKSDVSLIKQRDRLREKSERAARRCQELETQFDIHRMGENLPQLEDRLMQSRLQVNALRREFERLSSELAALRELSPSLPVPVTAETVQTLYARKDSLLQHWLALLGNKPYRLVQKALKSVHDAQQKLSAFARLHTNLTLAEDQFDLQQREVDTTRNWLQIYVDTWGERFNDKQILEALRETIVDELQNSDVRAALKAQMPDRFPASLDTLYVELSRIDQKIHRFYANFEARYTVGREQSNDGEMAGRRRTPSQVAHISSTHHENESER